MMKKLFPKFPLVLLLAVAGLFVSCDSSLKITTLTNGATQVNFDFNCGPAIEKLVANLTGEDVALNTVEISSSLEKQGFSQVQATANSYLAANIKFTDEKNILFEKTDGPLTLALSPAIMLDFYKSCDAETQALLDLFLSPVFNEESMTQDEYLETVASLYGKDVSAELKKSNLNIEINQKKYQISLVKLLTLDEILTF